MQDLTFRITVKVPDGTDAGDVALVMADRIERLAGTDDARAETWTIGPFELESSS